MNQTSASGPIILHHKRHALTQKIKSVSHLIPALILLSGVLSIGQEGLTPLLGLELLVGGAYVVLLVREWQHLRYQPFHHAPVEWLELAAAGILALEGYHIWHRHHEKDLQTGQHRFHVLPWLYAVLAVWYVGMAFGAGRLHERRHLHLHGQGFSGRLHPFGRRFSYTWADIARLEPDGPADLIVHYVNGRQRRISLAKIHEGPALRDQLLAHQQQRQR